MCSYYCSWLAGAVAEGLEHAGRHRRRSYYYYSRLGISRLRSSQSRGMKHVWETHVSAPSSSLLRFLRSQSEDICFFTSNSRTYARRCSLGHPPRVSSQASLAPKRSISTSKLRQATALSSFVNLDGSRTACARESPSNLSTPPHANRLWPCVSNESNTTSRAARYASTDSHPFLKKILGRRKSGSDPKSNEPPPLPSFLDEAALGRSKTVKGTNELKLRCTEFNDDGKVTLVNGEFKKTELIAKVCSIAVNARRV